VNFIFSVKKEEGEMAVGKGTNRGGKGKHSGLRQTVASKRRTEEVRRRHNNSDVEKEPDDEDESSPEKPRTTSKFGHSLKKMSEAEWASEEEDEESIVEYQVSNHEDPRKKKDLEIELDNTRKDYEQVWNHCSNLKKEVQALRHENEAMKKEVEKVKRENHDLEEKVYDLAAQQAKALQESAAFEVIVSETYGKVGKFVKDDLFHHKKFVNDDYDLNEITDVGSVGKQTMDHFGITQTRRVAWWNTYKKAAADAIANQRSTVSSSVKRELKGMCQTVKKGTNIRRTHKTFLFCLWLLQQK
jgi:hypothetical protein